MIESNNMKLSFTNLDRIYVVFILFCFNNNNNKNNNNAVRKYFIMEVLKHKHSNNVITCNSITDVSKKAACLFNRD